MTDILSSPPLKRRRIEPEALFKTEPYYYYALGTTVIAIRGLVPERDLAGFQGALVPDAYDIDIDAGASKEFPLWVPPYLWPILLASPNPIADLVEANMLLREITVKCRRLHTLSIICDLGLCMNSKASQYWTQIYDDIVDSICRDLEPSNEILPYSENIISIARLIKRIASQSERDTLREVYPELFWNTCGHVFPLWAFRDVVTATGKHRQFLERVLHIFLLFSDMTIIEPLTWPDIPTNVFSTWLAVYWRWRNHIYTPEVDGMYFCLTSNLSYRHAVLHENTRKLFKHQYGCNDVYFFQHEYNLDRNFICDPAMVDPTTGDIVDLATSKDAWTPELVQFYRDKISINILPAEVTQNALRTLPSVVVSVFTRYPFRVHPVLVCLLNAHPLMGGVHQDSIDYAHITGVPRTELHWENLDAIAPETLRVVFEKYQFVPKNICDPTRDYMCLDPRIRRVLKPATKTDFMTILLMDRPQLGDMPFGKWVDRALQRHLTSGSIYTIHENNAKTWRALVSTRALTLFPKHIRDVAKQIGWVE